MEGEDLGYELGSSTSSSEGGCVEITRKNEDSLDSGTGLTYIPAPRSPRNSRLMLPAAVRSISQEISMPSPKLLRPPTPDGSIYTNDAASLEMSDEEKRNSTIKNMVGIFSCIYAILLIVAGGVVYINHQTQETRHISELFSVCICVGGMLWLIFFHIDLFHYKQKALKKLMGTPEQIDTISTCTGFNFAITFLGNEIPPYRFLTGRHSGSFYLKIGLAAFCFGHLINEGLTLGQHVLDFVQEDRAQLGCGDPASLIAHIIKPLYSFYQLFIVFKYSNIVINRHKVLASFALMHIIATCICFWFGTIVEDALEDYHHKLGDLEKKTKLNESLHNNDAHSSLENAICSHDKNNSECQCAASAILSVNTVQAVPYLYPFTIEFNLLLAGVWFIVWQNIGKEHPQANPHHFRHRIQKNDGIDEVTYQSNLVISADCHASNKGLFSGLFILMTSIISVIIFFVAMSIKEQHAIGLYIHYVQEGTLTILCLIGVLVAYRQLTKLDYNRHPITFLDDALLFIPLPFFFVQALLTIMSEYKRNSTIRIVMCLLVPIQVILQTPLIMDGLRRCSNSQVLRFKKPGREVVTFLIVCNLTMWIINTFEAKSVESHYGQNVYFGEFLWMFISHTTLPLMLFYRFHSSVCLADIWKSAYEKGE